MLGAHDNDPGEGKDLGVRLQVPETRISYRTAMRWQGLCHWLEGTGNTVSKDNRDPFYIQVRALGSEGQRSADSHQVLLSFLLNITRSSRRE